MKPISFSYYRPKSLAEALDILAQEEEAKVIAGGQSLVPLMNFRLSRPKTLVDINGLRELAAVEADGGVLRIGALVRHQELLAHPLVVQHFPALAAAAAEIGHWAIRTRGTIGGSLVHADPAAELPAATVAHRGVLVLTSAHGERRVDADAFFYGYLMTDIAPDELLTAVELPLPSGVRYGFAEHARRPGDFALAGAFVEVAEAGHAGAVTWFGVGGRPDRQEMELSPDAASRGRQFAAALAELDGPEDEVEARYRRQLAAVAAEQAYQRAIASGRGN
ncbi:FAD binding domain-containing protein [Alicyclobacillus shizuokensis]|uniref:FAD binding domain-containing protein n=1 Tax=Alicyclobacillus shizuokensis TaxID=392014 RepID=UPI00082CC1AA|nr:FAD binding domain-containing protein [Alicyclobacillus shizuokensis]MCL6626183.1 FAD binding domain-containing protein [Alicyclobacillus shizuokensis]